MDGDDITVLDMRLSNGLVVRSNARTPAPAMFTEVFRTDVYTPEGMPPVEPNGIVVDVGASIGLYALMAARRWPHASIHALEPAPDTFALLVANVSANSLVGQVMCQQVALAGHTGTAELSLARTSACDTLLQSVGTRSLERAEVRTITLDNLFDLLPSNGAVHLKVDAEGSEFDIFESASTSALARIAFLAIECHDYMVPRERCAALFRRLKSAEFSIRWTRTANELILHGWH